MTMKVIDSKGKDQIKEMRYDEKRKSFDRYFTLLDRGKYQVIVPVKRGDYNIPAGISYELK